MDKLTQKTSLKQYPDVCNKNELGNLFADFFTNKIQVIHDFLSMRKTCVESVFVHLSFPSVEFCD